MLKYFFLFIFLTSLNSCYVQNWSSKVKIDSSLDEVSAIETSTYSNYYWVIQDAGNNNILYGLNRQNGEIATEIEITNARNKDWEDITKDSQGNIYIGDIGSNSKNKDKFKIYKIKAENLDKKQTAAEIIAFKLPENKKNKDFEAFFLLADHFYIFSKEKDESFVYRVPNKDGEHKAEFVLKLNLEAKNSKVTSADISPNGNQIVLLNHDKVWLLEDFNIEKFTYSNLRVVSFGHDTQKEGVSFLDNNTLLITDERNKGESFIYTFKIK